MEQKMAFSQDELDFLAEIYSTNDTFDAWVEHMEEDIAKGLILCN